MSSTYSGLKSSPKGPGRSDSAEALTVAVVYEDTATRERAMSLCDHLVHKLWEDVDFEFSWWKCDYLSDPGIAADATVAASGADMIIFSGDADQELSPAVKSWTETWAARRENREGALVALIGMGDGSSHGSGPVRVYLRDVAQRAGMDYLTNLPDDLSEKIDGTVPGITQRAAPVNSVLERFLQRVSPASHWGINE